MSWVYLPGPVVAYLPPDSSAGKRSAQLKSNLIVKESCSNGSTTVCLTPSLSGTTSGPLTDILGEDTSTSLAEVSRVRIFPAPVRVLDLQANAADSGSRCCESLEKYSLSMPSSKTLRICAPKDWKQSSRGLPTWGMMQLGACWELGTSVRRTNEIESGSLLPTPTGAGNEGSPSMQKWPGHQRLAQLMATPTASGSDMRNSNRPSARATQAMLPPPTCRDWKSAHASEATHAKNSRPLNEVAHRSGLPGRSFLTLREWMMGMPIGWTGLEPLEMHKFAEWQQQHGEY